MLIDSRPTEIIIYFWKQKVAICVGDEFDSYHTMIRIKLRTRVTVKVRGLRLGLGLGLGFGRLLSCV